MDLHIGMYVPTSVFVLSERQPDVQTCRTRPTQYTHTHKVLHAGLRIYIYVNIRIYVCVCIYIYMYMYIRMDTAPAHVLQLSTYIDPYHDMNTKLSVCTYILCGRSKITWVTPPLPPNVKRYSSEPSNRASTLNPKAQTLNPKPPQKKPKPDPKP